MKLILSGQSTPLGEEEEEVAEEADAEDVEAEESEDVAMAVDEIEVSSIPIDLALINLRRLKGFSETGTLKGFQETCPYQKAQELVRGVGWDYEAPRRVKEGP